MSRYRRIKVEGATYFFTVAISKRGTDLLLRHVELLRTEYSRVQRRYPFETIAICVLPDHLHAIWSLPSGDANYPMRWSLIKSGFSRKLPSITPPSLSKQARREKGIWQRRYWEHTIRDDADLARHIDYVHFNPVRHGFVSRAYDWPYGSFRAYVEKGILPEDWGGDARDIKGAFGE